MAERISDLTGTRGLKHSERVVVHNNTGTSVTEVEMKRDGFSMSMAGAVFFALFWNGFVLVWTLLAAQGSLLFAAFSIPFWVVGLGILFGIITQIFGSQRAIVNRDSLVIQKILPFRKAEKVIPYSELKSIECERQIGGKKSAKLIASGSTDSGLVSTIPTITYGESKELMFGEHLKQKDRDWVVEYLNEQIVPLMKFVR